MPSKYKKKRKPKPKNWAIRKPTAVLLERKLRKTLQTSEDCTLSSDNAVNSQAILTVNTDTSSRDDECLYSIQERTLLTEPVAGPSGSRNEGNLRLLCDIAMASQFNHGTQVTSGITLLNLREDVSSITELTTVLVDSEMMYPEDAVNMGLTHSSEGVPDCIETESSLQLGTTGEPNRASTPFTSPELSPFGSCCLSETCEAGEADSSHSSKLFKVKELLPSYYEKTKQKNLPDILPLLLKAVFDDTISELSYLIIYETLQAVSSSNPRAMRFSEKTKLFWLLLKNRCGSSAIRLLGGWKSQTSNEKNAETLVSNDIVLAVPDPQTLAKFRPYQGLDLGPMPTGLHSAAIGNLVSAANESSIVVSFDGKKLQPGLKNGIGRVDMGGFERNGMTVAEQDKLYERNVAVVQELREVVVTTVADERDIENSVKAAAGMVANLERSLQEEINETNKWLIKYKDVALKETRTGRIQDSRYAAVISSNTTRLHRLQTMQSTLLANQDVLNLPISSIHQGNYASGDIILSQDSNFTKLTDYTELPVTSPLHDTLEKEVQSRNYVHVKQRTPMWFGLRDKVKLTGSRLHDAVGLRTLKKQKELFDFVKVGKSLPDVPVTPAMEHGIRNEINATATFCGKILPWLFPNCYLKEVGCYLFSANGTDVLVSPDGVICEKGSNRPIAPLEIKCPFTNPGLQVPWYYYIQAQFEIAALREVYSEDVTTCYLVLHTSKVTRVFSVPWDSEVYGLCCEELRNTYGSRCKRPTRFSSLTKTLKPLIQKNCKRICHLASVSSVKAIEAASSNLTGFYGDVPETWNRRGNAFNLVGMRELERLLFETACDQLIRTLQELRGLLLKPATELVTFIGSTVDRLQSKETHHGCILGYVMKGRSHEMETIRSIKDTLVQEIAKAGGHCAAISFDGLYLPFIQKDGCGGPLTKLELCRQHWSAVRKMSKKDIIDAFVGCNRFSLADVEVNGTEVVVKNNSSAVWPATCRQLLQKVGQKKLTNVPLVGNSDFPLPQPASRPPKSASKRVRETKVTRVKTVPSLADVCVKFLKSDKYSKSFLEVSYAEWSFPQVLEKWKASSRMNHELVIDGVGKVEWFMVPEFHKEAEQLIVNKVDPTHILTRIRSAMCNRDIGKGKKSDLLEVARQNNTKLKFSLIEDKIDMQNTDFALIMVSKEVQDVLEHLEMEETAELCEIIREWFEANDEPGIPALDRCHKKLRFKNYLMSFVNLDQFPPPKSYVAGIPIQTFETAVASVDADLLMYGISARQSYNCRSVSSQLNETFYGCLATAPGANNGVPNAHNIPRNLGRAHLEFKIRTDPNKGWNARLTSAPLIKIDQLEREVGPLPKAKAPEQFVSSIVVKDHFFDAPSRGKKRKRRLKGLAAPNDFAPNAKSIRTYHRFDGEKNTHMRANIRTDDVFGTSDDEEE